MSGRTARLGVLETRVGRIGVLTNERGALARVHFAGTATSDELRGTFEQEGWIVGPEDEGTERALAQIAEYFDAGRRSFELDLALLGTPFQARVWQALREIPYGRTTTYGEIAEALEAPGAARAIGRASHVNPVPIVVPCHRVVGADGELVGFGGGLEVKELLLEHERAVLGYRQELLYPPPGLPGS